MNNAPFPRVQHQTLKASGKTLFGIGRHQTEKMGVFLYIPIHNVASLRRALSLTDAEKMDIDCDILR
jgi:hypothetical protein